MLPKKTNIFSVVLFLSVMSVSCKKNKCDSDRGYPKNVNIEYKVTATAGAIPAVTSISFTNETGGSTDVANAPLPFSRKITRSVKFGDDIRLGILLSTTGTVPSVSIKLEILVDGTVVETKTYTGTSTLTGAAVYGFF